MEAYRTVISAECHGTPWRYFYFHGMPQTAPRKKFIFSKCVQVGG
jgi:hypothetical protein